MRVEETSASTFRWPPRPLTPEPRPAAEPPGERPPSRTPSLDPGAPEPDWGLWHTIESAWLGLARAPLGVRARRAGWTPDEPAQYCPRCATTAGSFEPDERGCRACRGVPMPWSRAVRLGAYEGLLRDLVHEVKFTAWRSLGVELGRLLGAGVAQAAEEAGLDAREFVVVPVPTTLRRRIARGIDHSGTIAAGVAEVLGARVVRALRRKHGPSQVSVAPSRRVANVRRSMRRRPVDLAGRRVLIVDDVRTTGATLAEACRALRSVPAEDRERSIWVATIAVTPMHETG